MSVRVETQKKLIQFKNEYNLFTIQEAAAACNVSEMTVRNFEALKSDNCDLFWYYYTAVENKLNESPG